MTFESSRSLLVARLTQSTEWATRTPRFLFRGFHAFSGGGPATLVRNSTKGIVPHLFGGAKPRTLIKSWSRAVALRELSPADASKMIRTHLGMRLEPTAFSSWTSDYQTALLSAIEAANGDYKLFDSYPDLSKRHIAILDTSLLGSATITEVLQVSALHEAKLADADRPCDFLVYGPVKGTAFRAVPLSNMSRIGLNPREVWIDSKRTTNWTDQLTTDKTLQARKIAEKFCRENDKRPDVILAVLAAELSRQRAPKVDMGVSDMFKYRWKKEEVELIVSLLKKDIATLRLDHGGKAALVNRSMYVHRYPQLHLTANLLEAFMDAGWKARWALPPQGHLSSRPATYSTRGRDAKKRPLQDVPLREGSHKHVRPDLGQVLVKNMKGLKTGDADGLPRKASYFVEAEAIAGIIADALKRIARLNLQDLGREENEQGQRSI